MSLTKILLEFNITDQEDVINHILKQTDNIAVEVDHYISSGYWGDVFKVKGKNKIVKLTNSSMEFNVAKKLIDENFDHVINIFFAKQLHWYEDQPFLIVAEYLESDSDVDKLINTGSERTLQESLDSVIYGRKTDLEVDYLVSEITKAVDENNRDRYKRSLKNIERDINDQEFYKYFLYILSFKPLNLNEIELIENSIDILNEVITGLKELHSIDIKNSDFHFENVLKDPKTNNYKIIDIQ